MCSDHEDVPIFMHNQNSGWRKCGLPAQQIATLHLFQWCVYEREVNKCPHINLASLKVMTSDVMTDPDREVIIHACRKFSSWIEAVTEATGVFIK
jgi:hypothetical protein